MAPYRQSGYSALSALMSGMGLPSYQAPQGGMSPMGGDMDVRQLRDMLAPQYTSYSDMGGALNENGDVARVPMVDEAGLDAAVRAQMGRGQQAAPSGEPMAPQGPGAGDFNRDFTLADFQRDPGYQFRMDEGRRALERSAAARGGLMGGGTLKALERYAQGYASNEYGNAYNRFNADRDRRFNRLSSLAGIGQTASRDVASMGQQTAAGMANNTLQAGNAAAAGSVGQANAISGGLQTLGNYWQQQQMLKNMGGYGSTPGGAALSNFWTTGTGGD